MTCRFIKFTSNNELLQHGLQQKDIYQTFEYNALEAYRTSTEPYLFLFNSDEFNAALPVLLNRIPENLTGDQVLFDAKSSYGYPGILFSSEPTSEQLGLFFNAVIATAAEENIVSIFIRLHPYYNQFKFNSNLQVQQQLHGKTVFADLKEGPERIATYYSSSHVRGLKSLKQNGFHARINNWEDYPLFQAAYFETMHHVNAASFYFFEPSYFNGLHEKLPSNLHIIQVYNRQDQYATGALYMTFGEMVQYHLGGTLNNLRKMAPSKLVFDIAIRYFSERGFNILHLGGGVGSLEDSLFNFKKGFGRHTLDFSTVRCIVLSDLYDQLVKKHLQNISLTDINYFPLYRLK